MSPVLIILYIFKMIKKKLKFKLDAFKIFSFISTYLFEPKIDLPLYDQQMIFYIEFNLINLKIPGLLQKERVLHHRLLCLDSSLFPNKEQLTYIINYLMTLIQEIIIIFVDFLFFIHI